MSQTATAEAPRPAAEAEVKSLLDDIIHRMEVVQQRPSPVRLKSWEEIERFAEKAARSGMVPKDFIDKPDAICVAVQMGSELGLAPMQALQNIAVVNGRPAIWGDAIPGLCRASGKCRTIREWHEGEGDALTYFCEAIRADDPQPVRASFSTAQAKRANLWKDTPTTKRRGRDGSTYEADSGPWYAYPERMLQMRARGFCLRDAFPDVLKGLISAEEAQDIPFEATGLVPAQPPQKPAEKPDTRREEINAAVPMPEPKRMTIREWLDEFEADCAACHSPEVANEILKRESVLKLDDPDLKINQSVRDRALAIRAALVARIWPTEPLHEDDEDARPDDVDTIRGEPAMTTSS